MLVTLLPQRFGACGRQKTPLKSDLGEFFQRFLVTFWSKKPAYKIFFPCVVNSYLDIYLNVLFHLDVHLNVHLCHLFHLDIYLNVHLNVQISKSLSLLPPSQKVKP